jgi:copper chaperone CopZ
MQSYCHSVPGRLRIKIPQLRHQPARGERTKRILQGIDGVTSVTFNPLTGSLVVLFDSDRTAAERISGRLCELGVLDAADTIATDEHIRNAMAQAGLRVGKVVAGWALSKALEARGLSLLAALI